MKSTQSFKTPHTPTKSWEVYIIETAAGKLYTGITNNFERRFAEHAKGAKGAKFFHFASPVRVLLREPHKNRSTASKREAAIKKMSRDQKLALIRI